MRACVSCCDWLRRSWTRDCTIPSPDSVLLITLDSCRYDSFRRSTTQQWIGLVLCTEQWLPAISPSAPCRHLQGFLPSVRAARPLLNSKLAKLFRLAHAGWPGKEREEFQLQGPSIVEGFRRQGYLTVGSGAVGWFDPQQKPAAALPLNLSGFFIPAVPGSWRNSSHGSRCSVVICRHSSRCFCF